jgi:hypothetical protein
MAKALFAVALFAVLKVLLVSESVAPGLKRQTDAVG